MGYLDDLLGNSSFTSTGPDPSLYTPGYFSSVKANNPTYYETIKQYDPIYKNQQIEEARARDAAATASSTSAAAASNPVAAAPAGPSQADSASAALGKLLAGFGGVAGGASFVPNTLDDPTIENIFGTQRGKAQDYLGNLLKRGVITTGGQAAGQAKLAGQEPGVRSKLNDVGNLLLEQERGKVRGIYNQGAAAAGSVGAGASFDPTPYVTNAQNDVSGFTSGLADAFSGQISGDLFDTSGLAGASGVPSSGQTNFDFDPYAGTGGKLNTGLNADKDEFKTRRNAAVF